MAIELVNNDKEAGHTSSVVGSLSSHCLLTLECPPIKELHFVFSFCDLFAGFMVDHSKTISSIDFCYAFVFRWGDVFLDCSQNTLKLQLENFDVDLIKLV